MTFEEKLKENKRAYFSAKADNKELNREVATRNNTNHILIAKYDSFSEKSDAEIKHDTSR
ncbi:MAG: hypothetical protein L3J75_14690 [Methylococcaceae bacterium]|nr:hypothetical protein [Methylococcaceae bacterium]